MIISYFQKHSEAVLKRVIRFSSEELVTMMQSKVKPR